MLFLYYLHLGISRVSVRNWKKINHFTNDFNQSRDYQMWRIIILIYKARSENAKNVRTVPSRAWSQSVISCRGQDLSWSPRLPPVTPTIKTKKQRNQLAQPVSLMIDQPNKKYYSLLFSLPAQTESRTITAEQSLHSPAEATFFSDRRSYWRVYSSNQRKNSRVDSAAYLFSRSSV